MPFARSSDPLFKNSRRYVARVVSCRSALVADYLRVQREGVKATGKKDEIIAALLAVRPNGVEPYVAVFVFGALGSDHPRSLEPAKEPVRRSKRTDATEEKAAADNDAENEEHEEGKDASPRPSILGDSISQCKPITVPSDNVTHIAADVPSRQRRQAETAAQNAGPAPPLLFAGPPQLVPRFVTPPLPSGSAERSPPSATLATPTSPPQAKTPRPAVYKPKSSSSTSSSKSARLGQPSASDGGKLTGVPV